MLRLNHFALGILTVFFLVSLSYSAITVTKVSGEVKYRRGLEEQWHNANKGLSLEDIDTILILEGEAVLKLQDGSTFKLGRNSILDISEIQKITTQQMFLYVMSQKVKKMEPRKQKAQLKVGNVSAVHGSKKTEAITTVKSSDADAWTRELNTAKAMYNQEFYPNSVVKLHKILNRYSDIQDCGQVFLYLGKSFEALDETGQAIDNYQLAVEKCLDCEKAEYIVSEAKDAIKRLSR